MPDHDQKSINRRQNRFAQRGKAERPDSPDIISQPGANKALGLKVFKITSASTKYWTCREQKLSVTYNVDNIYDFTWEDKNTINITVLNLMYVEDETDTDLAVGDIVLAYKVNDGNDKIIWAGFSPRYAYWHA